MITKILFDSDGYSTFVGSSTAFTAGMDDIYDVSPSATGCYIKDNNGNITSMTQEQYDDKYLDYKQSRSREYPPIGDQLDEIWKVLDGMSVSSAVLDSIKAVKVKYPKV